jgi:hypothetical protein
MQCRLCLQERELHNSHIIPEFLYRPGYDEKGRMFAIRNGDFRPRYIQQGLRERLLCAQCEGLFANQYEDYFSKLWYVKKTLPSSWSEGFFQIQNLDYTLFKLFHLSILWRAAISSLSPFLMVSLDKHEEQIRQMLLNSDPGPPTDYQIFGVMALSPGTKDVFDGFIVSPTVSTVEDRTIYMFVFGGCIWHYVADSRPIEKMLPISLSSEGVLNMPVRDLLKFTPVVRFIRDNLDQI